MWPLKKLVLPLLLGTVATTAPALFGTKVDISSQGGHDSLSSGTKTETVTSGAACVCSSETSNAVHCSVSSTTLTVTGTGTDAFDWLCTK